MNRVGKCAPGSVLASACVPEVGHCITPQAVEFVNARLDRGVEAGVICQELLDACLAKNPKEARGIGCDNMTANIVVFKK